MTHSRQHTKERNTTQLFTSFSKPWLAPWLASSSTELPEMALSDCGGVRVFDNNFRSRSLFSLDTSRPRYPRLTESRPLLCRGLADFEMHLEQTHKFLESLSRKLTDKGNSFFPPGPLFFKTLFFLYFQTLARSPISLVHPCSLAKLQRLSRSCSKLCPFGLLLFDNYDLKLSCCSVIVPLSTLAWHFNSSGCTTRSLATKAALLFFPGKPVWWKAFVITVDFLFPFELVSTFL